MEKDITTKDLVSNYDVFADIVNVNLFDGAFVVSPDDLSEVSLETSYKDLDGKHHRLFRDTLMRVEKLGGCIAFVGFENQVDINRAMPVRDMGYTYSGYARQIKEIVAKNRAQNHSAYAQVLHTEQKLIPIATFILYFGKEKWTTPISLMDVLDIPEEEKDFWRQFINDYRIHVIHMVGQTKELRDKYQSDFGVIADYLACYDDKEKLMNEFACDQRRLLHVEQVLDMLDAFSDDSRFAMIKQRFMDCEEKEENNRMCLLMDIIEERGEQAYQDGYQDGFERGLKDGMKQGMQQGMGQGIEQGMGQGIERILVDQVCRKIRKRKSIEVITEELEQDLETIKAIYDIAICMTPHYNVEEICRQLGTIKI